MKYVIKHKTSELYIAWFNPVNMSVTITENINEAMLFSILPTALIQRYKLNDYQIVNP